MYCKKTQSPLLLLINNGYNQNFHSHVSKLNIRKKIRGEQMLNVPKLVVLNLTTDCNLRCKYCYAGAGEKKFYMPNETAIKVVKELKEINGDGQIKILFHGGEPLMCLDVIKQVVSYCEANYKPDDVDYYIQTNCVLLDDQTILYLKEKNIKLSISIDGCDELTNGCRILPNGQNSFSILDDALNRINKHGVNTNCLAVLNKCNYQRVGEIIDYFVSHNVLNFSFNYFIKSGRGSVNSSFALTNDELFETTKKIIDKIEEYYKKGIRIYEKNVYYLVNNIVTKRKLFMCANSPCGAGLNIFGITPKGDIFPCDDLSSQEQFCLGNINEKHLKDILENPIVEYFADCSYSKIKECAKCNLKKFCGAGCCSRKFFENGDIYSKDPICDFYKLAVPYVSDLIGQNKISLGAYNL